MRPDPQQTCEACGTAWFFHPGPIAMCRELQRLRKIEAAVEKFRTAWFAGTYHEEDVEEAQARRSLFDLLPKRIHDDCTRIDPANATAESWCSTRTSGEYCTRCRSMTTVHLKRTSKTAT